LYKDTTPKGKIVYRPILDVYINEIGGWNKYDFIVDSGADISLMPEYIAEEIGLDWEKGQKIEMRGISQKEECFVEGRIHEIDIRIPDINLEIQIPVCFAKGNTPFLLGREGFFDYFRITFEKEKLRTVFELIEE